MNIPTDLLRTLIAVSHGLPEQQILKVDALQKILTIEDTRHADPERVLRALAHHRFVLNKDLPIRAHLAPVGAGKHLLMLVLHHIAADGVSAGVLWRDLAQAYRRRRAGLAPYDAPLAVQYADYALWQRKLLERSEDGRSELDRQLDYWLERLEDKFFRVGTPANDVDLLVVQFADDVFHP